MMLAVLNHLWQSTLFAGAAGALALMLRGNAAHARYAVWFAASLKFLVPFSFLTALGSALTPHSSLLEPPASPALLVQWAAAPFTHSMAAARVSVQPLSGLPLGSIALFLWAGGTLVVAGSWLARWLRLRAIVRRAIPLAIAAPVPVRCAFASIEPGLVGFVRPVILLPEGLADRLSPQELRAVFAHELCHLRRRDNLTAAIHMIVEALFWFFPVTWWLGTRLLAERERACDEAVLAAGNECGIYAESILKVCKWCLQSPVACVAGVAGADLQKRVESIMSGSLASRVGRRRRGGARPAHRLRRTERACGGSGQRRERSRANFATDCGADGEAARGTGEAADGHSIRCEELR